MKISDVKAAAKLVELREEVTGFDYQFGDSFRLNSHIQGLSFESLSPDKINDFHNTDKLPETSEDTELKLYFAVLCNTNLLKDRLKTLIDEQLSKLGVHV